MPKGICDDGVPVDKNVRLFQLKRDADALLMVQKYYDDFKTFWFNQVEDLIEREEFDREWCLKLLHSVDTYDEAKAIEIGRTYGWSLTQKFNRWFYSAIKNWISNVKTQAFRVRRRPGIFCPICFREVCKIEERHLQHVRTTKDIPKIFEYGGKVYKTYLTPKKQSRYYNLTMSQLKRKVYVKSSAMDWPWFDGENPAVMCPYTKSIVPQITDQYIASLPKRFKHYALPYTWLEFQDEYPNFLVYSELMSLDYSSETGNKSGAFVDKIAANRRILGGNFASYLCPYERLSSRTCSSEYEYVVSAIEKNVSDSIDQEILKYILIGYDVKDVCEYVGISRKEFKVRIGQMKDNKTLEETLLFGIIE